MPGGGTSHIPSDADWKTTRSEFEKKFKRQYVEQQGLMKITKTRRRLGESLQAYCRRYEALALKYHTDEDSVVISLFLASISVEFRRLAKGARGTSSIPTWSISGIASYICHITDEEDDPSPSSAAEPKRAAAPPRSRPYCTYHRQSGCGDPPH